MTDVEAFVASQQRYRCEGLSANLTAEQCTSTRLRIPAVFACEKCAGLGKKIELEERTMGNNPVKECVNCHDVKTIKGRGLCGHCYHKLVELPRKAGNVPTVERVMPVSTPQAGVVCTCGAAAFAKGMCRPCYDKQAHARRNAKKRTAPPTGSVMAQAKAAVPVAPSPAPVVIPPQLAVADDRPFMRLLRRAPVLAVTLDFTKDEELFHRLIALQIDADQIIGVLSMLVDGELVAI